MNLSARKVIELEQKLNSLKSEFQEWRDRSEEYKPLEKHHTQINRITKQLDGLQEIISSCLKRVIGNDQEILAKCRELEAMVLEVHRIWGFFRSKLILRNVEWFKSYLDAADDLAWVCYKAAQEKVLSEHVSRETLKEPPLVFFNGGSSPFAVSRNWAYQAEEVPGEALKTEAFTQVLKALPIPIIGIPWFQIQHLPDAIVIAHEVGHNVEEDS